MKGLITLKKELALASSVKGFLALTSKITPPILVAAFVLFFIARGIDYYLDGDNRAHRRKIFRSEVRGNRATKTYRIATCSGYETIDGRDLEVFSATTIAEREGYRRDANCDYEDIELRKMSEDYDGYPESDHDGPL